MQVPFVVQAGCSLPLAFQAEKPMGAGCSWCGTTLKAILTPQPHLLLATIS